MSTKWTIGEKLQVTTDEEAEIAKELYIAYAAAADAPTLVTKYLQDAVIEGASPDTIVKIWYLSQLIERGQWILRLGPAIDMALREKHKLEVTSKWANGEEME